MLHVSALFGAIIRHKLQELLFSSFVFSLIDLIDHRSWGRPSAGIQRSGFCTEINRVWSASTSFWQWTAQVVVCLLPLNDVHALQTHWNEMQLCLLGGSEFYFFLLCSAWPVHRVKIKLTINSTPPPPKNGCFLQTEGCYHRHTVWKTWICGMLTLILHGRQAPSRFRFVKSNGTPTWCNTVQVLFLQSHCTCFGRQAPIIRSI